MSFRITGLPAEPFKYLYGSPDAELKALGVVRMKVDAAPGFPDRIELREARPGETVMLVNYEHQPAASPYRASHAIFVREGAEETYDRTGEIPEVMRHRLLSLRGFDGMGMMVEADVVEGSALEAAIARFFANARTDYIHVHNAKQGCYSGRIDRV